MAEEIAATHQVPIDLAAILVLGVASAAAALHFRVHVGNTHTEPPNIYVAAALPSGDRKSAAFREATQPLEDCEEWLIREAKPMIERLKERRTREEAQLKHLRDQAVKCKNPAEATELGEDAEQLAEGLTEVPAYPRLLAADATPEALTSLIAEQGGIIAVLSPEGGGVFDVLGGRYSQDKKPNFDVYLLGYDEESIRVDRQGRAVRIPSPRITAVLTVQPDVIQGLAVHKEFEGRGFLGRWAYILPASLVGHRENTNRPLREEVRSLYRSVLENILSLPEPPGGMDKCPLHIAGAAWAVWDAYAAPIEHAQAEGGDLASMRSWASKAAGRVARIAGILHVVAHACHKGNLEGLFNIVSSIHPPVRTGSDGRSLNSVQSVQGSRGLGDTEDKDKDLLKPPLNPWTQWTECGCGGRPEEVPIAPETVAAAAAIGDYLLAHAQVAYRIMGADPATHDAERIVLWFRREHRHVFTLRDAHRKFRKPRPQDLLPALEVLELRGYIRPTEAPKRSGPGRPLSPRYEVNPAALLPEPGTEGHGSQGTEVADKEPVPEREPGEDDDLWEPS
jgi:hypothetical protein